MHVPVPPHHPLARCTPLLVRVLSFLPREWGRRRQPGKAVPGILGVARVWHGVEHALDNLLPMR